MSKKRTLLFCLLLAMIFSAAVLVLRFPIAAAGSVNISAAPAAKELLLTGSDGAQVALELLPGEKVNINTATAEELMKLPGIGETLSRAIIAYRQENGNFSHIEDIMEVSGIGEGRFAAIEDYICVERET